MMWLIFSYHIIVLMEANCIFRHSVSQIQSLSLIEMSNKASIKLSVFPLNVH